MGGGSKLGELQDRLDALRRDVVDGFADRAEALRRAAERLDAGDAEGREAIRRLAHRLRGIAANAGHPTLTDRAGRLEDAAGTAASDLAIAEGARRLAGALDDAAARRAPAPATTSSTSSMARSGFALGWRVVALDDEPSTRRLLAITLKQAGGCDAHVTDDPGEAMARAEAAPPDLVIVDAMMPDVDGLTFYRGVRQRVGAAVPVVILSAASPEELGWTLPDDPRLRWMRKPFRPGALLDELRGFLDGEG